MKKNKLFFFFLCYILPSQLIAQSDSSLSLKGFFELIKQYHPVVKQSGLRIQQTIAAIQMAKGNFDPTLQGSFGSKELDQTRYYSYQEADITLPTWYGITLDAGVENMNGQRLNSSETEGRLVYAGVEVPLAKNLIYDKRRAALHQAQIQKQLTENEQLAILNDLMMDAAEKYWQWVKYDRLLQILKQNLNNTRIRMNMTRSSFLLGERAAIDTLEAFIQVQNLESLQLQYQQIYFNARMDVSAFLWNQQMQPVTLTESIHPDTRWEFSASSLIPSSNLLMNVEQHPLLKASEKKIAFAQNNRKLKFQELLPKVNLQYRFLDKKNEGLFNMPFQNNYQYGLKVGVPVFWFEGRGAYRAARLKVNEAEWDYRLKQWQLEVKMQQYTNEVKLLKAQLDYMETMYQNQKELVTAEEKKMELGESSLFLVNTRENKLLELMEKWMDLKVKSQKAACALLWSTGTLHVE